MTKVIKVGDTVTYRPGFGADRPVQATVESMEVTQYPREKYGIEVDVVTTDLVRDNRVVFSFDNGHWGYSSQLDL